MKKSATLAEKLTRDTVAHSSGCHVWVGLKNHKGYGRISHGKKRLGAHRVAHELHIGPIPPGFHVDHLCGNRACVNPAHLEAVTPAENNARSDSPSGRNARATHCKRGHLFTAESTHLRPNGSRLCAICYPRGKRWMKPSGSPPEAAVGATAAIAKPEEA